jgi:PelA/Pel-15E family pectate lyase
LFTIRFYPSIVILLLSAACIHAQAPASAPGSDDTISVSEFGDSAHHWRDIRDEDHVIAPLPGQKQYPPSAIAAIADNVLLYQKRNGGWPKNYDMQAVLTAEQKSALKKSAGLLNTTFDNGATHAQVAYLAAAYARTGDRRYKAACLKGIDFILAAQYRNGGWPQFYPEAKGYARFITFNDGAMIGVMKILYAIVSGDPAYGFVDRARKARVTRAYAKGIECILRCQITDRDTLTAWCQQHDEKTLLPQSARTFEPACISNLESAEIAEFLMSIDHPTKEIVRSVEAAAAWFSRAAITGIRLQTVPGPTASFQYHTTSIDRVVVRDSSAAPIWSRYTELETHRALFSNRNWKKVYSLAEVDRERRTGYRWYTDAPRHVLDRFAAWQTRRAR